MPDTIGNVYIGEDNLIRWRGLYDKKTKAYVNDATITWVFRAASVDGSYNASGALVSAAAGTMELDTQNDGATASVTGDYVGVIEDDAAFTESATYWAVVTATASGDRIGSRKVKYVAGQHGGTR
ncbi:MAG: hypothetical protein ACREUY_03790 [Burkholderiales bacterium]